MGDLLGQRLLKSNMITEEQLARAVERQRLQGGRLGQNLVDMDIIAADVLAAFCRWRPAVPRTAEETGLDLSFIADLVIKHVLFMGEFSLPDVADRVKLPMSVLDPAIEALRRERFVEVKGAGGYAKATYNFAITGPGRNRASELFEVCRYSGPAPVTLADYTRMVDCQTVKHVEVRQESVREAFDHIVIGERLIRRIGPAISSGKAIFLYGPAGNGKTTIAETMGKVLPETVYMPHSVLVGGQVISVFDAVNHLPAEPDKDAPHVDPRWTLVKRPVIMTGGELTLRMLELEFNTVTKYYEAPLQMKANNGLFIVDDFGRQQIEPQGLLNRWIVPLERRTDFLSLHTGMKFEIPFDQLVIFSTNIEPKKLVDEAFLRRIRYKIHIDHPTEEEYRAIFMKVCKASDMEFRGEMVDYLMANYYRKLGVKLNACHPRDLVEHIIDSAHYFKHAAALTKDSLDDAWANYFVEV